MFQLVACTLYRGVEAHLLITVLLLCSLLLTVHHLVQAVYFLREQGFVSSDLKGVSLLVSFRQVCLLRQGSVGAHSYRRNLCDPRVDLLQHLLAGRELFVILVEPLFLFGQSLLLNLVVQQLLE